MNDSNYGLFSPIPKFGFPDYKRGSGQWYDWLDQELHFIENGYEVGGDKISGRLYFKLNWTKMLITDKFKNKRPMYPFYADGLREFYDTLEHCFVTEQNLLYGKGRDKGFTYDISAVALYQMQFVPYSNVLGVFPGGQSPARDNFKAAYSLAFDELDPDMKCYPDLSNNKEVMQYGWHEKDFETGAETREGNMSKLTMKLATDPDVGKSGRYKIVLLEEFGEIERAKELIITSDANMRQGGEKFGIIIAGGTSNAMKGGYKDFRDIWHNPEALGFVKLFCPAQKMYWGFVNPITGKSDQEGAKEHRQKIRDKLKPGSTELMIEKQNYPFNEQEMFIAISKSPFNPEIASARIGKILTDQKTLCAIQRGNLVRIVNSENGTSKVEFVIDNNNGRWYKFKGPLGDNPLNADVGAVDSYRFGETAEHPDSKGAIIGYRPFQGMNIAGNLPTFIYHHRYDDKELFFEDCLLSAEYWNMKLLIEKTDEDIFTYFRQRNAMKWLKRKPKLIQNPYAAPTEDYGVSPSGGNKEKAVEYAVQDFLKHVDNIVFVDLLDELINFGSKNTDLAMAYIWAVLHACDSIRVLEEFKNKPEKKKKFSRYTISDGRGGLIVIDSEQKAKAYETNGG